MEIAFLFILFVYQLFEFHENETKHEKRYFMRGTTVTFASKVSNITGKISWTLSNCLFCE